MFDLTKEVPLWFHIFSLFATFFTVVILIKYVRDKTEKFNKK